MTTKIKCATCGDSGFEDDVIYGVNPITLRQAIMHADCFNDFYDDLQYLKSSNPAKFINKLDEYQQRVMEARR